MLDNSKQSQNDILITVKRSYGKPEPQLLLPKDNLGVPNLSFEVEFSQKDSTKAFNLLKSFILLIVISQLPSEALDEVVQTLEQIREFYSDYSPTNSESTITTKIVNGKIVSTQTRDPIILEWD